MMRRAAAVEWWALGLWAGSRLLVLFAAVVALGGLAGALGSMDQWKHWDAALLAEIAQYGYGGDPHEKPDPGLPGFLPGLPLLLRGLHYVLPSWTLDGLLISLVASAVATFALLRLGEAEGPRGTGPRAVAFLLISPWAVFLAAGYTEATFLAFALPAWLCARRGRWGWAGILAALAAAVRITGLFLALALIVMFMLQVLRERQRRQARRRRGRHTSRHGAAKDYALPPDPIPGPMHIVWHQPARWHVLALVLPFLPLVAFAAYLHVRSGDWLAWLHAQEAGWGRRFTWPWQAFGTTWDSAVYGRFAGAFRAEIAAAVVGVALCVYLLLRHRYDELVYVGLQVGALLTSAYYLSVTRSTLLWWPLWLLLGRLSLRHRWLLPVYLVVSAPLMAWYTSRFVHGQWAG